MEELNNHIMEIIGQHQTMIRQLENTASKAGETDKYGYPFEYNDSFASDPLEFTETTMQLQIEAAETYRIMREINRHSPLYFQMSAQLEKLVNQLGSACITKAVIEQQEGKSFQMIENLTINRLREMAAFNFRKCFASFMESQGSLNYNAPALSFSIRWAALDRRLLSTAEKIEKIKAGKITIKPDAKLEKPEKAAVVSDTEVKETKKESEAALSEKGRSLPINKTALPTAGKETRTGVRNHTAEASEETSVPAEPISESAPAPIAETKDIRDSDLNSKPADVSQQEISGTEAAAEDHLNSEDAEAAGSEQAAEFESDTEKNHLTDTITKAGEGETDPADDPPADTEACAADDALTDEDYFSDEDEDNLPYVSEDLVRRIAEMIHRQEALQWPFPTYEYADPPS